MKACNSLSIDVDGLWNAIQQSCLAMINEVAERIIVMFGHYAFQDGAGRHEWRQHAAQEFQKISEEKTNELVRVEVGLNTELDDSTPYAAQIMVALFGNHPPIMTKPGATVWNNDMTGFKQSTAHKVYSIPQFDWPDPGADNWVINCFKLTKTLFDAGVASILQSINFADYVYVSGG